MKYCSNCGAQLEDEAKFCPRCGNKTPEAQQSKEPYQQPKEPVASQPDVTMASDAAGEVVLCSWKAPKAQPEQPRPSTPPPSGTPQGTTRSDYQSQRTAPQFPQGTYQASQAPKSQYQSQNPTSKGGTQPEKKKSGRGGCIIAIVIIVLFVVFLVFLFSSCKHINLPPDPGTPVPAPHSGVFVHGADTLIFNGDGKTIAWHFENEIPRIGNEGQGQYVFRFGHGQCRYDVAEAFIMMKIGEQVESYTFVLPDFANDTTITILRGDLPGTVIEAFCRTGNVETPDSK